MAAAQLIAATATGKLSANFGLLMLQLLAVRLRSHGSPANKNPWPDALKVLFALASTKRSGWGVLSVLLAALPGAQCCAFTAALAGLAGCWLCSRTTTTAATTTAATTTAATTTRHPSSQVGAGLVPSQRCLRRHVAKSGVHGFVGLSEEQATEFKERPGAPRGDHGACRRHSGFWPSSPAVPAGAVTPIPSHSPLAPPPHPPLPTPTPHPPPGCPQARRAQLTPCLLWTR